MKREEEIDRYLQGLMSAEEQRTFEKRLKEDEKLLEDVRVLRMAMDQIVAEGDRKKRFLQEVERRWKREHSRRRVDFIVDPSKERKTDSSLLYIPPMDSGRDCRRYSGYNGDARTKPKVRSLYLLWWILAVVVLLFLLWILF